MLSESLEGFVLLFACKILDRLFGSELGFCLGIFLNIGERFKPWLTRYGCGLWARVLPFKELSSSFRFCCTSVSLIEPSLVAVFT
jgi:hypothetical protein